MKPVCPECDVEMEESCYVLGDKETGKCWVCPECDYDIDADGINFWDEE